MFKEAYTMEAVRAYFGSRCTEKLNDVVIIGDGHFGSSPAQRKMRGFTMIALNKSDLVENASAILALFAPHEGMVKTRDRRARMIRNDLQKAGISARYEYVDVPYSDLPKGENGTRSTAIEKIACAWLEYRWSGEMLHSALYDHETNARLGREGGRAVADGYNVEGALEVKCKRGRTTFLSDIVK